MIHRITKKDGGNEREIRRIALEKLVESKHFDSVCDGRTNSDDKVLISALVFQV